MPAKLRLNMLDQDSWENFQQRKLKAPSSADCGAQIALFYKYMFIIVFFFHFFACYSMPTYYLTLINSLITENITITSTENQFRVKD